MKGRSSHAHQRRQLLSPISECKFARLQLLRHRLLLVRIGHCHILHMLKETLHITHPQQLGDEWIGSESFEIVEAFSRSQEDDGRLGGCDGRDSTSSFGVSVKFSDDNCTKVGGFFECTGLSLGSLTDRGIEDHDGHVLNTQEVIQRTCQHSVCLPV